MTRPATVLEIVATSGACAAKSLAAGADRLEACEVLELGGITPSPEVLDDILANSPRLGVHALLRSRPGDFRYTSDELSIMVKQAQRLVKAGVHGLVLGALTAQKTLDITAINRLIDAGKSINPNLEITLHRAIDSVPDPLIGLAQILELPVTRVLTSGGRETVGQGLPMIKDMVALTDGKLQIMSGGGMKPEDIHEACAAGVAAVHFSAKINYAETIMVDEGRVREVRHRLDTMGH